MVILLPLLVLVIHVWRTARGVGGAMAMAGTGAVVAAHPAANTDADVEIPVLPVPSTTDWSGSKEALEHYYTGLLRQERDQRKMSEHRFDKNNF